MTKKPDSIRDAVDRRLSALCVPDDLAHRVLSQARQPQKRPRLVYLRRPIAVAAVLCFVVAGSMGVLASATPSTQNLFSLLGAQVSSLLQPIERSCLDSGIETTVVAAMNDSETVDIYVAVKDLEGTRVNKNTALGDVELLGLDFSPDVQQVQFDEKSMTATFRIEGRCGKELNGKKVTLSIGKILLDGQDTTGSCRDTGVSVAQIASVFPRPEFQKLSGDRTSSSIFTDAPSAYDDTVALLPAESDGTLDSLLPWGTLMAGGVSDHMLHLLVRPSEVGQYASVSVCLSGDARLELDRLPIHSVSFHPIETSGGNQYFEYTEFVLPLPEKGDWKKINVAYYGRIYKDMIVGEWKTTFQLESVSRQKVAYTDLTVNDWHVTRVELSPMGVCVAMDGNGSVNDLGTSMLTISAYDANGHLIEVSGCSSSWDGVERTFKNQFATPLPLDQISKVTVGGQEITFK